MLTAAQMIREVSAPSFSFELLPPLKGNSIKRVFNTVEVLKEFKPLFVNITSHRDEVYQHDEESGLVERLVFRKRPGTVAVAAAIKHRYGLRVVPHIICNGFTKSETEYALIDLNFLGIHDLLFVRGDSRYQGSHFQWRDGGHKHTLDLIHQVTELNKGHFLDSTATEVFETPFSFGVAGYPEKHVEAPDLDSDVYWLKKKVDAGAEYVITQMFFDNNRFFDFVKRCRKVGIDVPIVPGLKPVTTKDQLSVLPDIFNIQFPTQLAAELRRCKTDEDAARVGVEWSVCQSKELLANGFNLIHFFSMMATGSVSKIAGQIY
ncbi:methylenetetrahydrofolate reductase [Geofilum sp. OHC36d9]|uniref:methylenetetrahydrofolate reductase n=1 Tax=Geofilum sp. OHC36d9 TaxID=3458413 RepID=UPI004034B404